MKTILKALSVLLAAGMIFCCAACAGEENKWIPPVQGSQVLRMPYEEIDGEYAVEKYTDFKSFKKSALADYNFNSAVTAKEERYSAEFFKTRDLAVIKFNRSDEGANYTITDAVLNGNDCTVKLLALKQSRVEESDITYYCFLETEKDISDWNISLDISEVVHSSFSFGYMDKHNMPYLFENESCAMFRITAQQGVMDFFVNDEVLDEYSYIHAILRAYSESLADNDILLVRVPSNILERIAAAINGGAVEITGTFSDHYTWKGNKTRESKLIVLLVPKDFTLGKAVRTNYAEYEDNADNGGVRTEFVLSGTTQVTDGLIRYDITEKQ